ncbi:MAG: 3-oxoacyl-ACP reductase FabG [Clostridia bacterium]|nr:3-oxoacyl-ACP reductase FabG [Clostridia bacterium]
MNKGCAIVTGGSRGIGKAISLKMSEMGLPVVINYNFDKAAAKAVLNNIENMGGRGIIFRCDVSDASQVKNMISCALSEYGNIYALINNAGISQIKLFGDITLDEWHRMEGVCLDGVFNCCQAVLPNMIHNKSGRIVNISSVWGVHGASCEVHYSAVKAGVIGLTKALAKEVAPSGITVNAVAPGCILTDMLTEECSEETLRQLAYDTPVGRLGTPEDVAHAVSFFVSESSDFITGQILGTDGGYY